MILLKSNYLPFPSALQICADFSPYYDLTSKVFSTHTHHVRGALCCPLVRAHSAASSKLSAIHSVAPFDLESPHTEDESHNDHVGSGLQLIPNRGVSLPV